MAGWVAPLCPELPGLRILAATPWADLVTQHDCIHAGAVGRVPLGASPTELAAAIRQVHAGEVLFPTEVLLRLVSRAPVETRHHS